MSLLKSMVGIKIVMSLSGLVMFLFAAVHLLGNMSFFSGPDGINAYAGMLHSFAPFLWCARTILAAALCLHIWLGIRVTLENRSSGRSRYAVRSAQSVTFAGRSMIWSGLLTGLYIVFHLAHFTFQIVYPEYSSGRNHDASGRADVFLMIVRNFEFAPVAGIYILSAGAVGLHLSHGLQSMIQTLGLNNERTLPVIMKISVIAAALFFLGYASIPAGVMSSLAGR